MAAASNSDAEFESWLSSRLKSLNTDDAVLVEYVKGILEGEDEDESEKREALMGILAEISTGDVEALCQEIIKQWILIKGVDSSLACGSEATGVSVENDPHLEDKIAQMMLQTAESSVVRKTSSSNHNSEVKKAILAQYSEVCDVATDDEAEGSDDEGAEAGAAASAAAAAAKPAQTPHNRQEKTKGKDSYSNAELMMRNTNAEAVAKAEREKRDKAKAEAEEKRQQDKLNREKQKQASKDRDEKEKKRTQKGERRR